MTQLDICQATAQLPELVARARAGEEVIISEAGKPDVRLVATESDGPVFGAFKSRVVVADDFDDPSPLELLTEFLK